MRGSKTVTNSLWDTDAGDEKPSGPVSMVEEAEGVLEEKMREGNR